MRGLKILGTLLLVVAIVAASTYLLRYPIAGFAIRRAMAAAGLENPQARVTALALDHIRLEDVAAGPAGREDIFLGVVETDFRWRDALQERRADALRVGPGRVRLFVDEDGLASLAGISRSGGNEKGSDRALPFDRLKVNDLELVVQTPEGDAKGKLIANYDVEGAGGLSIYLDAAKAGAKDWLSENAALTFDAVFDESGRVAIGGDFSGDLLSPYGRIRGATVEVSGEGTSWKDIAAGDRQEFAGAADIRLGEARVEMQNAGALTALNDQMANFIGGPLDILGVSGAVRVSYEKGALLIEAGDAPIAMEADTGARVTLDAAMGAPFFSRQNGRSAVAGVVMLRGGELSATASLDAYTTGDGWRFNLPLRMGALSTPSLAFSDMSAVLDGVLGPERAIVEATASGQIDKALIGRLAVADAPVSSNVFAEIDWAARVATIELPDESCARLNRLSLAIAEQDITASLEGARLCGNGAPLARIDFQNALITDFAGDLSAQEARYRLGETRLVGRPPMLNVTGRYEPAASRTRANASAKGGSVRINDILRIDQAEADIVFGLEEDGLTIEADAKRLRMTEYADAPKVAPIIASGTMILKGDEATFAYRAETQGGAELGKGTGVHNIDNATGQADFEFNRLVFAPGRLQPDRLAPVLKGFIGVTEGAAEGRASFSWRKDGVQSEGDFTFDDVTFGGPGLTVTETVGVNAEIAFSSLWPVATDGAQTMTVRAVDFGALQLEKGEIVFDMPGDDTLVVERAIFPWFGGQMGVRDARASFAGGEASAPLQVEAVDLKQILDYVDVDGLSGTGTLNGVLPLVVEGGRASIQGGRLTAEGPGNISYVGKAGAEAAAAGGDAKIAFDVLRDLRYERLGVAVDGPLDGRLDFRINFEGSGEVNVNRQNVRVPVKYNITLDAALLELLNQANLSRNLEMQIQRALDESE